MNPFFARRSAEALVQQLQIADPPVDVEAVARSLGLRVMYEDLGDDDDVSGVLIRSKEGNIVIQKKDAANRQRFTIAHEIGHFHLRHQFGDGGQVHVDKGNFYRSRGSRSSEGIDPKEVEANQFAASLLMPAGLVKREVRALGARLLLDHHITSLAERFEVSEQAMTIRLTRLGFL
jgi:Zn-dependent peptidase ImmA (M78 family)